METLVQTMMLMNVASWEICKKTMPTMESRSGTEQVAFRVSVIVCYLWTSDLNWNVDVT